MKVTQESVTICEVGVSVTNLLKGALQRKIDAKLKERNEAGWKATSISTQLTRLHISFVAYDVVVVIIFTRED